MSPSAPGGVRPVRVFVARNLTEARLAVAFLEDRGIRSRVEDEHTHEALAGVEKALDQKEGIGVCVASTVAESAAAALEEFASRAPLEEGERPPDEEE
jgi:hypothetical protein